MREFKTGATRNSDDGKFDYEGFLSPLVLERFAEYMHEHRVQEDGKLRDSDNWQKGMPVEQYMKSLWRHHMDVWKLHRGLVARSPETGNILTLQEALCAVMFNAMGMLHETIKAEASDTSLYRLAKHLMWREWKPVVPNTMNAHVAAQDERFDPDEGYRIVTAEKCCSDPGDCNDCVV